MSLTLRPGRLVALVALVVGCAVLAAACGSGEDVEVQRREPAQQRTGTTAATTGGTTAGTATLDEDSTTDAEPRVRPDRPPRSTTTRVPRPAPAPAPAPSPAPPAPEPTYDPALAPWCEMVRSIIDSDRANTMPMGQYLLSLEGPLQESIGYVPPELVGSVNDLLAALAKIRPAIEAGGLDDGDAIIRWGLINLEPAEIAALQDGLLRIVDFYNRGCAPA